MSLYKWDIRPSFQGHAKVIVVATTSLLSLERVTKVIVLATTSSSGTCDSGPALLSCVISDLCHWTFSEISFCFPSNSSTGHL